MHLCARIRLMLQLDESGQLLLYKLIICFVCKICKVAANVKCMQWKEKRSSLGHENTKEMNKKTYVLQN